MLNLFRFIKGLFLALTTKVPPSIIEESDLEYFKAIKERVKTALFYKGQQRLQVANLNITEEWAEFIPNSGDAAKRLKTSDDIDCDIILYKAPDKEILNGDVFAFPGHFHPNAETNVVLEGTVTYTTINGSFTLHKGQSHTFAPEEDHSAEFTPSAMIALTYVPSFKNGIWSAEQSLTL